MDGSEKNLFLWIWIVCTTFPNMPTYVWKYNLKCCKNELSAWQKKIQKPSKSNLPVNITLCFRGTHTAGIFWLNAAETWVDILGPADQNVVSSIVNFVSGSTAPPQIDSHFISETGIIDTFFMLGPNPKDVFRQYTKLTGTASLPQASVILFC